MRAVLARGMLIVLMVVLMVVLVMFWHRNLLRGSG
jgi:hypothetical protein